MGSLRERNNRLVSGNQKTSFNLPTRMAPMQSRFVHERDLLYPCDWVRARYMYYCYLQVTEHVL
jgi:hypothetical protein